MKIRSNAVVFTIIALIFLVLLVFGNEAPTEQQAVIKLPANKDPRETSSPSKSSKLPVNGQRDLTPTNSRSDKSIGQQVSTLAASSNPSDKFAAYKILMQCAFAHKAREMALEDANSIPSEAACGDISPGQLTQRYMLVKAAAEAHVEGSAVLLLQESPDGRPIDEVIADPAYAEWKQYGKTAIVEAASRGDTAALLHMATVSGNARYEDYSPVQAISYWTAYADVTLATRLSNQDFKRTQFEENVAAVKLMHSQSLDPVTIKNAIDRGHKMAAVNSSPGNK